MMMPLDLSLDLSVHSTCHAEQEEFDAILAILAEEEGLTIEQVMELFEKEKGNLPDFVVDFVEARFNTFRRNLDFVQEEAENLAVALEEDDLGDVLKEFVQARVHTFHRNMVTISSLITTSARRRSAEKARP